MPEQRDEILKYSLDLTEVEAGAQRMLELLATMKAKRGAGEDTTELEASFQKELSGLQAVMPVQKQAAGATEDLLKQKEKLAATVSLLGGRFGGLVGQLGNVVELLLRGGHAALGFAGALAAITGLATAFAAVERAIDAALKKLAAFRTAQMDLVEKRHAATVAIEEQLLATGNVSPEVRQRAMGLYAGAGKTFGMELSPQVTALAAAGGVESAEEAGVLNLLIERFGLTPRGPEGVRGLLDEARASGLYGQAQQMLGAWAGTEAGRDVQATWRRRQGTGPTLLQPRERAFLAMREAGTLPEGVSTYGEFAQALDDMPELEGKIRAGESARRLSVIPDWVSWGPGGVLQRHKGQRANLAGAVAGVQQEEAVALQQAMTPTPTSAVDAGMMRALVDALNQNTQALREQGGGVHIGTQYNHGKNQHKRWRPVMGASKQDHRAPPG